MRIFAALCVSLIVLAAGVCVLAQELDQAKLREINDRLDHQATYTSKWLGGPRHIWYLEFTHEKIRPIRVCAEEGEIEVYYYMLYTLKNKDEADHEVNIRLGAWSDKQPCPNKWDETLKNYRHMHDLKYRDTYVKDVVEKVSKKHFLQESNGGKGLYSLAEVTVPEKLGKATETGSHGDEMGINSAVIKAGETWQCVAIFKKIDAEMDYLRIFVYGLTNDFNILTHLDIENVREYRGMDLVLMKNGEMIRCRSEERLNDLRMFVRNVAKQLDERIEKLTDVEEIIKSNHTRVEPNQRLIVEKILEITYERLGDEFYVSNDWVENIGERWYEWIRVVNTDLPHSPVDIDNPPVRGPGG